MEIDSTSFSCDIIVEEKFIPDVNEQDLIDHDVPNVNLDQIEDHQNQDLGLDQNPTTQNNEKSQLFNGQLYKCICNKRYKTQGTFETHKIICTFRKSNLLVCRIFRCHQTFDNQADFEAHKLEGLCKSRNKKLTKSYWDTIEDFTFECDHEDCTAKFPTKRKLYNHKVSVHIPRKFACLYCDLTFKKKTHKIRHEKRMHFKRAKTVAKKTKKLDKSQEFIVKCEPKIKINTNATNGDDRRIKSKVKKIETSSGGGRITRSQNKKTSFERNFELEKSAGNRKSSAADSENEPDSDGDTSTTASFIDQDDIEDISDDISVKVSSDPESDSDENGQVLDVSKQEKNVKKPIVLEESDEYLCSICHESFTSKTDAKNHEKNCQNVKKPKKIKMDQVEFKCEYEDCDQVFKDIGKYNYHIDVVHLKIPQNKCKKKRDSDDRGCFLCRKNFRFKKDLEAHIQLPHKINCSKCCRIFVESAQLERHVKYDHLEELKKFKCRKCAKKFMTEHNLKSHNEAVHNRKMKICPICSNEVGLYKFPTHLENHKKNESGVKSFCTTCQVYFANKTDLEKHKGTELHLKKLDKEEEFILPHDDLNTVDSILLIDKRSDEGIFDPVKDKKLSKNQISKCHDCGLKFRNYYYREAHQVKIHGYQKPEFHCTICDMNFCRKSVLDGHIKKSTSHKMKEKELKKN